MTPASATITAAQRGRKALTTALFSLQTAGIVDPRIDRAIEATAAASSALYEAEQIARTEEAAMSFIHAAAEALQRVVTDVNWLRPLHPQLEATASSLASTLAVLYPVLKRSQRQRRARLPAGGLSEAEAEELRAIAGFPRAPTPTGRERRPSRFAGSDRRRRSESRRVFVEVEIGLTTDSHIYTGLSLDVSTGGVFVATYEPAAPGTPVSMHFVLPDGFAVNADGVVRWTRAATSDAPPGMGVAFAQISVDALNHIAAFCASRPPLYFDE